MAELAYTPTKFSRTTRHAIRGLDYSIRIWGPESAPTIVLLHGILDTSATFQFFVDALRNEWRILAPDWRGHGHTARPESNGWFHDYLADLDRILDVYLPNQPVNLVGHSLGGNVANVFCGLRPARVRRMVSIDAFGMLDRPAASFPQRLIDWLDGGRPGQRLKTYSSLEAMVDRLCLANPRLTRDKALYLANESSRRLADGSITWQFDVHRQRSVQTLSSLDEWFACWRRISCPALWIAASEPRSNSLRTDAATFARVLEEIGADRFVYIENTGHHVQHDAPQALAEIVEDFLNRDG